MKSCGRAQHIRNAKRNAAKASIQLSTYTTSFCDVSVVFVSATNAGKHDLISLLRSKITPPPMPQQCVLFDILALEEYQDEEIEELDMESKELHKYTISRLQERHVVFFARTNMHGEGPNRCSEWIGITSFEIQRLVFWKHQKYDYFTLAYK